MAGGDLSQAFGSAGEFLPTVTLQRCRNSQEWTGEVLSQYDLGLLNALRSWVHASAAGVYKQFCEQTHSCAQIQTPNPNRMLCWALLLFSHTVHQSNQPE